MVLNMVRNRKITQNVTVYNLYLGAGAAGTGAASELLPGAGAA
jgi:hypothetical protein